MSDPITVSQTIDNLLTAANAPTARSAIGAAEAGAVIPISEGGTGATNVTDARNNLLINQLIGGSF